MATFLYTLIIYPLIQVIELSFMMFNDVFKKPGISVIGVSLAVSLLCLPLYIIAERWQQVERDLEKSMQHGVDRIKQTFKGDEQYMMLSTFYRQHQYHPMMALRSSFGLLIQIPFFIAAYIFLSHLPALQGKGFLFIHDMGKPDELFHIGNFPVNVLPIAMTMINIVAGAIYTRGFRAKEKIQIYGMALVFLAILYTSPAGLVLYWTMNNVFSLIKNIFYKIKNPLRVLYALLVICIAGLDYYLIFKHNGFMHKRLLMAGVFSLLLLTPWVVRLVNYLLSTVFKPLMHDGKARFTLFLLSGISLCLLTGFVIPSYVINSSAVEFADIDGYGSPLVFLGISLLQTAGLFLFWPLCIYFLFHARIQTLLAVSFPIMLLSGLINAFCFSGDYGNLSRLITFSSTITAAAKSVQLLNVAAVLLALVLPAIIYKSGHRTILSGLISVILIAETGITGIHGIQIHTAYRDYKKNLSTEVQAAATVTPVFHLSKTGKNVFVFMLDRAENAYVEPIFDVFPELYTDFDGFTLYRNTVSFNQGTLLGAPPLYGGYEYTPAEINKRNSEKLVDKQNEALLIMPRIFTEQAGFKATVSDLSWANYSWIPDLSICKPYPNITGLNIERKYSGLWVRENPDKVKPDITSSAIKRNLIWFSFFKEVPVFMRDSIYDDGNWWSSDDQTGDVMEFIDYYSELAFLPRLTDFSSDTDAYFTIVNDTTHSGQELQAPDYTPAVRITSHGPQPVGSYSSVSGNIAAYKRLGEWMQYLKANGCYDNTRIILVSDHGIGTEEGKNLNFPKDWPMKYNPDHNHPLLFVKDFNAHGKLTINTDFMTNADVPAIAFKGIIDKPVNPYTGKEIKEVPPSQKKASGIVLTHNWRPGGNYINTFKVPDEDWYTVSENLFVPENWQKGIR
jgi:YidC/Oxa1 family membrane protein insertase